MCWVIRIHYLSLRMFWEFVGASGFFFERLELRELGEFGVTWRLLEHLVFFERLELWEFWEFTVVRRLLEHLVFFWAFRVVRVLRVYSCEIYKHFIPIYIGNSQNSQKLTIFRSNSQNFQKLWISWSNSQNFQKLWISWSNSQKLGISLKA